MMVLIGVLFCPLTSWPAELSFTGMFYLDEGNNVSVMDQVGDIYRLDWQTSHGKIVGACQGDYVFAERLTEEQESGEIDAFPKTGYKERNYGRFSLGAPGGILGVTPTGKSLIFFEWGEMAAFDIQSVVVSGPGDYSFYDFHQLPGAGWLRSISFSADQNYFFLHNSGEDGWHGRIFKTDTKEPVLNLPHEGAQWSDWIMAGAFHPTNPHVFAYILESHPSGDTDEDSVSSTLLITDFQTQKEQRWILTTQKPHGDIISWTPDGLHIILEEGDNLVLLNIQTGVARILCQGKNPVCF